MCGLITVCKKRPPIIHEKYADIRKKINRPTTTPSGHGGIATAMTACSAREEELLNVSWNTSFLMLQYLTSVERIWLLLNGEKKWESAADDSVRIRGKDFNVTATMMHRYAPIANCRNNVSGLFQLRHTFPETDLSFQNYLSSG